MTPLEQALEYVAHGWRVVPVLPGTKRPALTRWTDTATNNPDTVRRWWQTEHPDAGVGIVTGPTSGLWVLDVDDHDALHDLETRHHKLPPTKTSITGSGGLHLLYTWPDGHDVRNDAGRRLGPGLDVRGDGGFIVAPPTVHPTGTEYAWDLGEPDTPTAAPQWLVELVTTPEPQPDRPERLTLARSDRPGDRWAAATTWHDLLTADRWTLHHVDRDGEHHWTRPGKDPRDGTSATTGYAGSDVLKVFTSNPPPGLTEGHTYTKLGYLAATRWNGDHTAAARFLTAQGWGSVQPDDLSHHVHAGTHQPVAELVTRTLDATPTPDVVGWEFVDIAAILDGNYDPPTPTIAHRNDGTGLLYPGRVHTLAGEPGGGKTWVALWIIAQALHQDRVAVLIDYEDTPAAIVNRLRALNVTPQRIRDQFVYVRPDGPLDAHTVDRITALDPLVTVIDSVGESIAVEGLNPNADDDVATWYRRLPRRIAAGGSSVLNIDHLAKDRDTRGLFAIGSQRKLAAVDGAAYLVDVIQAPTREQDGTLAVKCAKDRHGTYRRGDDIATVRIVNNDDSTVTVTVQVPEGPARPTAYMERVAAWMAANALDAPFTKNKLTTGVDGKVPKIREAVNQLVAEGYVDVHGDGQAQLHTLVRLYRQSDDPLSDRYRADIETMAEQLRNVSTSIEQPVDNPPDGGETPTASHRVPPRPEPEGRGGQEDRVPASPAYVVAGTRDAVRPADNPEQTPQPRPHPLQAVPDELDHPHDGHEW